MSKIYSLVLPFEVVRFRFDADLHHTFFVGIFGEAPVTRVLQVVDQLVRQDVFRLLISEIRSDPDNCGFVEIKETRDGTVCHWIVRTFFAPELTERYELGSREYCGHIEVAEAGHPAEDYFNEDRVH